MEPEAVKEFLRKKRDQGLEAYDALGPWKRELEQPLPPSRYEVSSDPYGGARLVAVLEVGGVEVDRVALERGYYSFEGALHPDLREKAEALNALPPDQRPPVPFFPYGEEETLDLLQAMEEVVWTDREDYRGHPLRGAIGVAWRRCPVCGG